MSRVRHPAVPPALAILAGCALGSVLQVDPRAVASAAWLGWMLSLLCWRQQALPACVGAAVFTVWICGVGLASTASWRAVHSELRAAITGARGPTAIGDHAAEPVLVTGRLDADAVRVESGARLALQVTQVEIDGRSYAAQGGVSLTVTGDADPTLIDRWRRGRVLRMPALLRRPARYLNPGVPDQELALARRGTTLVGIAKSSVLVQIVARGGVLAEMSAELRARARRTLDGAVGPFSPRSAAIVRAILLGDRAGLDEDTEERLQEAGTYHVLAISGGNIAILAGLLLGLAKLAGVRTGVSHVIVATVLVCYAYLVGGGASVVRATLMAVIYLLAHAIDHRSRPLNVLAAAAGLSAAIDPLVLFDAGAWLTYGATLAILVGTPLLMTRLATSSGMLRATVGLFAASCAAEVALFPVSALVFSRVTAAGLVLNFAAIPLMTIVQIGGMTVIAASLVAPGAVHAAAFVSHLAAWGLVESARLVELMPWSVTRLAAPAMVVVAIYYAGWAAWLAADHIARLWPGWAGATPWTGRASMAVIVCAAAWIVLTPQTRLARHDRLEVTFIDVGQGAATLVRFPSGHSLLVDAGGAAGGRFDIGRRVVEPVMWAMGVQRPTRVVATHGDADHVGGAASIIRDLRPSEVWEGVPVPPEPMLQRMRVLATAAGATWRRVQRGDAVWFGGAEVVTWHPMLPDWERQRVRNDDSVVVEIRMGAVSVLLTGDVETSAEADLARVLPRAGIRVLQAPHHGSATSSTWPLLKAAAPDLAVISAGRGNRYGHPHQAVLERYRSIGAHILRTDLDGAITVRTDGSLVEVSTFTGRRLTLRASTPGRLVPPA
jgi:competence protein ComEC